jgi:hypothetical protein
MLRVSWPFHFTLAVPRPLGSVYSSLRLYVKAVFPYLTWGLAVPSREETFWKPQGHMYSNDGKLRVRYHRISLYSLSLSLWLYSPFDLGRYFSFLIILYTVGRTPWTGDPLVARQLPTHRTTQTPIKRTQTPMPRVGFEPTIPVFERAKMVHALDQCFSTAGPRSRKGWEPLP